MRKNQQKGISLLGGLVVLAIVGFFLTVALKVGPLYLDNSFVRAAMESLENEQIHTMKDRTIRAKIGDFFNINNVRDIDAKQIKITREKTHTRVSLDYEKRVHFMGNVDVVVRFENRYDSSK